MERSSILNFLLIRRFYFDKLFDYSRFSLPLPSVLKTGFRKTGKCLV